MRCHSSFQPSCFDGYVGLKWDSNTVRMVEEEPVASDTVVIEMATIRQQYRACFSESKNIWCLLHRGSLILHFVAVNLV